MTQLELEFPVDWWIVRNCWGPVYHVQDEEGMALCAWSLWPQDRWPMDGEDGCGQPRFFESPAAALAWCLERGVTRVAEEMPCRA